MWRGGGPSTVPDEAVRDDPKLDFGGAFEDLGQPGVAPVALDGEVGGVAITAVDLERLAGHAFRHFACEPLGHGGFLVAAASLVDLIADEVVQLAGGFDLGSHFGELKTEGLEAGYGFPELDALLRVGRRIFEATAGEADRARGGMGTS